MIFEKNLELYTVRRYNNCTRKARENTDSKLNTDNTRYFRDVVLLHKKN